MGKKHERKNKNKRVFFFNKKRVIFDFVLKRHFFNTDLGGGNLSDKISSNA